MPLHFHRQSVGAFVHTLHALDGVLDKASAFAGARGLSDETLLSARLYPDMFTLTRQVQIAADVAKAGAARLAGAEIPSFPDNEATIADLRARIAKTRAFLEGLDAAAFEGDPQRHIVVKSARGDMTFTAVDFLNHWALPNFYFHVAMAYGVLRHVGVELGKGDFLGDLPLV